MEKKHQLTSTTPLLDPQRALTVYLDALLCEVAFPDAIPSANADKDIEVNTPITIEESHEAVAPAPPLLAPMDETQPAAVSELTPWIDGKPVWAQAPFQCMTFQVGALKLAAPLEKLNGIVQWDDSITELPGYAPWFLGLLTTRGENVQVVDIAQIVIPPERRMDLPKARDRVKFVVLMEQGGWGIAVDSLSEVITLAPGEVRWSGENRKRQWLAGMVKERMSALLELDHLHAELAAGWKLER